MTLAAATAAVVAAPAAPSLAITALFTNGGGTGTWEDPNNWLAGAVPGVDDNAWIDSDMTVASTGENTIGGELQIGLTADAYGLGNPGGPATLNLNAGTLSIGQPLVVGQGNGSGAADSDGVFNIAAGATFNLARGRVLIGFFGKDPTTTTSGTVNLYGTFNHNNTDRGFNQVFHIGGNASDGSYNEGTLNMYDGSTLNAGINGIQVGSLGTGHFNMHGGTANIPFYLSIGTHGGNLNGTADVLVEGGTMTVGEFSVNEGNANVCTFTQTGGSVTVNGTETGSHTVRIGRSRNTAVTGPNAAKGIYSISGGTLSAPLGDIWVGEGNNGEMNVSGTGAVSITGGWSLTMNEGNRAESTGVINQSGGTVTIAAEGQTRGVFFGSNGTAIYNLTGGTLTTPRISASGGSGTKRLAISGGTVIANAPGFTAAADFVTAVGANGATLDSGEFDATWNSSLAGAGTLTKIGIGTLTLGGDNAAYVGNINVNAGTLRAASIIGSSTGMGAVTVGVNGTLGGTGNVGGATLVNGTLAPGAIDAAGALTFGSSVSLNATAKTAVRLAGSSNVDHVQASGAVTLAGKLQLSTIGGYVPGYGTAHRIVDGSSRTGRFASVEGNQLSADKWLAVTYDATGVSVTAALPGDANINGAVNFEDLLTLAKNYNKANTTWIEGEFDGNGTVGFSDLLALAKHYNKTSTPGGAADAFSADFAADWSLAQSLVPEPTLALLAPLGLATLARRRRGCRA